MWIKTNPCDLRELENWEKLQPTPVMCLIANRVHFGSMYTDGKKQAFLNNDGAIFFPDSVYIENG
jgi:hypothetical protein